MRLIDVEWQKKEVATSGVYGAEIRIFANNRVGLIVDISKVFTEKEIDILSINTRTAKNGIATIDIVFGISSKTALSSVMERLNQVESVLDIQRTSS